MCGVHQKTQTPTQIQSWRNVDDTIHVFYAPSLYRVFYPPMSCNNLTWFEVHFAFYWFANILCVQIGGIAKYTPDDQLGECPTPQKKAYIYMFLARIRRSLHQTCQTYKQLCTYSCM